MDEDESREILLDELRRKKKHVEVYGALPSAADVAAAVQTRTKRTKLAAGGGFMDERLSKARRPLPTVKKSAVQHLSNSDIKSDLAAIRATLPVPPPLEVGTSHNNNSSSGGSGGGSAGARPTVRVKVSADDIRVDRGVLLHFDTVVRRGDVIDVQDERGDVESMLVASISNTELMCHKDGGEDVRLWVSHLRSGKYAILDSRGKY